MFGNNLSEMASNFSSGFPDLNLFLQTNSDVSMIVPKLEPLDEHPPPPMSSSSEYNRILELFRSTFAERLQKYGDVTILSDSDPNSRAIVPVPNPELTLPDVVFAMTEEVKGKDPQIPYRKGMADLKAAAMMRH